jgi:hypothetical protein
MGRFTFPVKKVWLRFIPRHGKMFMNSWMCKDGGVV